MESGGICWSIDDGNVQGGSSYGCSGAEFNPNGLNIAYSEGPAGARVAGLVARDVTSATVTTSRGEKHNVDTHDGVIYWTAPSGQSVTSLAVTRAGQAFVESKLFQPS
jgi:hypothetical protein